MSEFYQTMEEMLNYKRYCDVCGEQKWICYGGAHVWDRCFNCEPFVERAEHAEYISLQDLAKGDANLDIAGYIGDYNAPNEAPPPYFEVRRYDDYGWNQIHERAYRKS